MMQLFVLLSILFAGANALRFQRMIAKARVTPLQYTPLIRLTEAPQSSTIQSKEDQPKPFSFVNTNIFAPFQKNVRSKVPAGGDKRNVENEGMNTIDDDFASRIAKS